MRMAKGGTLSLLLALPWTAAAQDAASVREFALEIVEQLGLALYRYDAVTAVATELMLARYPRPEEIRIVGWITTEDDAGPLVSFVSVQDGKFVAVLDIRPGRPATEAVAIAGGRPLTEDELTRHLARITAARYIDETCSDRYNYVVLRDPERDGWLVYFLAATVEPGVIPVGGHYRMTVSADGTRLLQADKLFRGCLMLNTEVESEREGLETVGLYMTHVVTDSPLEIHSFLSLTYGLSLAVLTPGTETLWQVTDGRISIQEIGVSAVDSP